MNCMALSDSFIVNSHKLDMAEDTRSGNYVYQVPTWLEEYHHVRQKQKDCDVGLRYHSASLAKNRDIRYLNSLHDFRSSALKEKLHGKNLFTAQQTNSLGVRTGQMNHLYSPTLRPRRSLGTRSKTFAEFCEPQTNTLSTIGFTMPTDSETSHQNDGRESALSVASSSPSQRDMNSPGRPGSRNVQTPASRAGQSLIGVQRHSSSIPDNSRLARMRTFYLGPVKLTHGRYDT